MAIVGFRHKGLGTFLYSRNHGGDPEQKCQTARLILARLSVAKEPRDRGLPGLNLHPLKGDRDGTWAVQVNGNWRVTFRFVGPDVSGVNYEDYH